MLRTTLLVSLLATPAVAASGPFFSLGNTDFVVLLGFLIFAGILIYAKVPARITAMLDARAAQIRREIEEARALRDEAQTILASYERKQKEMQAQADRIVANAKDEAMAAYDRAKADLTLSINRRIAAAEEQIASAEAAAIREVRESAIRVAVAAAGDVLAGQMTAESGNDMIETSIKQIAERLH